MAALSELDFQKILGDNYRDKLREAAAQRGISDELRQSRLDRDALEGKKFPGLSSVLIGLGLIVSTYATTSGTTFWIQGAVSIAFLVAGFAWISYIKLQLKKMDANRPSA